MGIFNDYVEREEDLLNAFNNGGDATWNDYGKFYNLEDVWNQLTEPKEGIHRHAYTINDQATINEWKKKLGTSSGSVTIYNPFNDYVDQYDDLIKAYNREKSAYNNGKRYEDYVNSYEDLEGAYDQAEEAYSDSDQRYEDYVNSYDGLRKHWEKNIKPTGESKASWGRKHYRHSLRNPNDKRVLPEFESKASWGKRHYEGSLKRPNERRVLPEFKSKVEWGERHYENHGERNGRPLPISNSSTNSKIGVLGGIDTVRFNSNGTLTVYYRPSFQNSFNHNAKDNNGFGLFSSQHFHGSGSFWGQLDGFEGGKAEGLKVPFKWGNNLFGRGEGENGKEQWGNWHWKNYGVNEGRVLPGSKFYVDDDGKLTYNESFVGANYRDLYDKIVDNFNNADKGDYQDLIENTYDLIPEKYREDMITELDNGDIEGDINAFNLHYYTNNVDPISADDLEQPPLGAFDPNYYATTDYGQQALNRWNDAQTSVLGFLPDLDVVGGYGIDDTDDNRNIFLHSAYTDVKNSGITDKNNRGNEAEETVYSNEYYENWDKLIDDPGANTALQTMYRDNLLGLSEKTPSGGVTVSWDEPFVLDEDGNIVYTTDEFGNQTPLINPDAVSFLEGSVFNVFGKKDLEQQDKFQALAIDLLKTSVKELNARKKRERELNIYKGLPMFNEIYGANSAIANSLLGDSGLGGYLSMSGANVDSMAESLGKSLSGVTGISNNSSVYNWHKWFDETLLKRYEELQEITGKLDADIEGLDPILDKNKWASFEKQVNAIDIEAEPEKWNKLMDDNNLARGLSKERALEIKNPDSWNALLEKYDLPSNLNKEEAIEMLANSENEINKIYTIEDDFRESFINDYIKPRFDQSKSMDEFISYLDTLDPKEQNIFQTQDAMQALKNVASAHAVAKLEQIKATPDQYFDSTFYFDPTVAIDSREEYSSPRDNDYREQAERVSADYETANNNPNAVIEGSRSNIYPDGITWNQYAYYYGVDLSNKDQFARLHYDAVGRLYGYDPARDITSIGDIKGYIVNTVIPKVNEAKLDLGDAAFSQFTTPEEFADALLEGIDISENNPEWKKILEQFGLDEAAPLDEVKEYIIELTRTGEAQEIREAIKYLNENKLKPTQDRLGISYIERDEDDKVVENEDASSLYQIFSDAGYSGSEDQFYEEFMPDAERGDIQLVTQAMGKGFDLNEISSDPFTALVEVSEIMGDAGGNIFGDSKSTESKDDKSDYFGLFDEKEPSYSDSGRDYIREYTAFFKD